MFKNVGMRREVTIAIYSRALEDAAIYKDEISDFLLDEMGDTFNCSLEDGSDQEVGASIRIEHRSLKSFCLFTMLQRAEICLL